MDFDNRVIDIHSHILPGIDDGSSSTAESLAMLEEEKRQGVSVVVATPHFYANQMPVDKYLSNRQKSYEKLSAVIAEKGIDVPDIILGGEIYYFGGIGKAEMLPRLCMEGTNIILLEMPFAQWTKEMLDNVTEIIEHQKLTVLLAHIERYYDLQKDRTIWDKIFALPIYAQINAGSFLKWKKRRKCISFLEQDDRIVIGSDCHNMRNRLPNLQPAREVIEKKLGTERLDVIDRLGERIVPEYGKQETS